MEKNNENLQRVGITKGTERRARRIVCLALTFSVVFLFVPFGFLLFSRNSEHNIGRLGESIGSRYYRYDGRIYLNIAYQGYYLIPQADAVNFQSLDRGGVNPLAKDGKAVYCGSNVIPGLSPEQISLVTSSYISDGQNVWYCSTEKDNPDYRWWQYFIRNNSEDSPEKARRRDFQLSRLEGVNAGHLRTMAIGYALDNQTIFYEGEPIQGSDAGSAEKVLIASGHLKGRESDFYLRDRNQVYFMGHILPGAHPASFTAMTANGGSWRSAYGVDAISGQYYYGQIPFPKAVSGLDTQFLQLLLADRQKANHELFHNGNGIWYWDDKGKGLEFACPNPFRLGLMPERKPADLAPGFWADSDNTFIAQSVEIWRRNRRSSTSSLAERATVIRKLGIAVAEWEKVADFKREIWVEGTLWKARNRYYFAPKTGNSHGFNEALYQVPDVAGLRDAIAQNKSRSLISSGLLLPVGGEEVCRASSHYPSEWEFWKN